MVVCASPGALNDVSGRRIVGQIFLQQRAFIVTTQVTDLFGDDTGLDEGHACDYTPMAQ